MHVDHFTRDRQSDFGTGVEPFAGLGAGDVNLNEAMIAAGHAVVAMY